MFCLSSGFRLFSNHNHSQRDLIYENNFILRRCQGNPSSRCTYSKAIWQWHAHAVSSPFRRGRGWGSFVLGRAVHLSLSHELDMHLITSSAISWNTLRNPNMYFLPKLIWNDLRGQFKYCFSKWKLKGLQPPTESLSSSRCGRTHLPFHHSSSLTSCTYHACFIKEWPTYLQHSTEPGAWCTNQSFTYNKKLCAGVLLTYFYQQPAWGRGMLAALMPPKHRGTSKVPHLMPRQPHSATDSASSRMHFILRYKYMQSKWLGVLC